jgi:hypothetical protein
MSGWTCLRLRALTFFGSVTIAASQTNVEQSNKSLDALLHQIQELRSVLDEVRGELAGTRRESQELRKELTSMREQLAEVRTASPPAAAVPAAQPDDRQARAEEEQVTAAKLTDLAQTKVASGSRYRLRLSGMALFNAASTRGAVDQIDLPLIAQPRSSPGEGSFAATVRQSLVSLEVLGPEWKGARTGGDLTVDFFGGFPATPEGVSTGLIRLRTAKVTLDWKNTSLVAGQEAPFFSPHSPTSLAATAYPAFSYTGNLWTWTPQVTIEHRWDLSERSKISFTGGVLDPLTGELPGSEYDRLPTAGERSRTPASAARLGWQRTAYDHSASLGAGGYYSRQHWQSGQGVDSWAATADWEVPLGPWFWLSGELFRGRAIAGLGGGANGSVLVTGSANVTPIDSAGGWTQLKFKPLQSIELNTAFGMDHAFLSGMRRFEAVVPAVPIRLNQSGMLNVIYQARSNLLFSLEYRRLRTVRPSGPSTAHHFNVAAGIIF